MEATSILFKSFESKSVGVDGLRYLVAWDFYRQLVEFTDPYTFRRKRSVSDLCYRHIEKVMTLAVHGAYYKEAVPPRMIYQTKRMVSRIRSAFEQALQSSSWLTPSIRNQAINKLIDITVYVGSPGRRMDPDYVEEVYKPYPDAPRDRLFPSWIKALSLSTQYTWADTTTPLYDDTEVNAAYAFAYNSIVVPPSIMNPPFLYLYGPIGLNYGGLGQ
ncbi:hypothetical protein MTO96_026779, partial [Rhipicephalus appendiculatus]